MITMKKDRVKAIVPRDWKYAPTLEVNQKLMHMTLIVCVSADGSKTRSTMILPLQNFPCDLNPYLQYFEWSGTAEGWITEEIFVGWTVKVLVPHVIAKRNLLKKPDARALLWLDGHSSRVAPHALELMVQNNIDCVTIPGHTSHVMQPLDNGVFNVFKSQLARNYEMPDTHDTCLVRLALVKASVKAIYHATEPTNVVEAFSRTGLCPFNPDIILNNPQKVTNSPPKPETPSKKRGFSISGKVITTPEVRKLVADTKSAKVNKNLKMPAVSASQVLTAGKFPSEKSD